MIKTIGTCSLIALSCSLAIANQTPSIYAQYAGDAAKIYNAMSEQERIGQLLQPSYMLLLQGPGTNQANCLADINAASPNIQAIDADCGLNQISQYHIGSVLTGAGPYLNESTLQNWANLNGWAKQAWQAGKSSTDADPVFLTGADSVHGNMHVENAILFPHNIGLGVTHDTALVQQIGQVVGEDTLASGFNWAFAPTVAVAQDMRWGRAYESFGADPALVSQMAYAYVTGLQNIQNGQIIGVLATAKHFIGDGATQYGLDEGDDAYQGDEQSFWDKNGQGYQGAVDANVGSLMASYSAIDGGTTRMHFGGAWNIMNDFKDSGIVGSDGLTYTFNGLVVSDWNGATRAAYFYDQATGQNLTLPEILAHSINGGVDMLMLGQGDNTDPFNPNSPANFTNVGQVYAALQQAVDEGLISPDRLQDAVTRILEVKLAMAHEQQPLPYAQIQAQEEPLALQAAKESLVLLKNQTAAGQTVLPVAKSNIQNVIFVGDVNDLGIQNGGWAISWQGQKGNTYYTATPGAATLMQGVKNELGPNVHYYFVNGTSQPVVPTAGMTAQNTLVIAVVAEVPYAEYMGDIANGAVEDQWYTMGAENGYNLYLGMPQNQFMGLTFTGPEADAIQSYRAQNIPVITVVYSGRPMILNQDYQGGVAPAPISDAVIAAFLPGTSGGEAVAQTIFGDYKFGGNGISNKLTFPWPGVSQSGAVLPVGYGLTD